MSRELADQVRAALGKNQSTGDVWETATAEPVPAEAPECAWCPLCRAARIVREAKPGRDKRVAAVGDALTTVVQDAVSVLEAALAATSRSGGGNGRPDATAPGTRGYPAAGAAADAETAGAAAEAAGSAAEAAPAGSAAETAAASSAAASAGAEGAPAGSAAEAAAAGSAAEAAAAGSAAEAAPAAEGRAAASPREPAAPGPDERAAPEPPEESPDEPDDRG